MSCIYWLDLTALWIRNMINMFKQMICFLSYGKYEIDLYQYANFILWLVSLYLLVYIENFVCDQHNGCSDIAHRAPMLFMDDKTLKRRFIFFK